MRTIQNELGSNPVESEIHEFKKRAKDKIWRAKVRKISTTKAWKGKIEEKKGTWKVNRAEEADLKLIVVDARSMFVGKA